MSKRELIDAFVRGDIDRRQFISRLTALGVSGGAAVAYAASLGQSASAGPARPVSGYAMRAQATDDEEYGGVIPDVAEGIAIAVAAIEQVISILSNISEFGPGLPDEVAERITTILEQQQGPLAALQGLTTEGASAPARNVLGFQSQTFETAEEFLTAAAGALQQLGQIYTALVPGMPDSAVEARQTTMSVAAVATRHAALVALDAGQDPLPTAFEQPAELG